MAAPFDHQLHRILGDSRPGRSDLQIHEKNQISGKIWWVCLLSIATTAISNSCFHILEQNYLYAIVKSCFADNDRLEAPTQSAKDKAASKAVAKECILLTYCFLGLMGSYLTWGVLQEKIMTREYVGLDGKTKAFFKDSQFLVFANRLLAFVIACIYLLVRKQTRHRAPLFKYSFASFSNIMSAWLQYEALKFISFPTQVELL